MNDIYKKLRERLDMYSLGFPSTQSGIEYALLRKLFSEQDAELFLAMSPKLEKAADVAARIGSDPDTIAVRLEEMARRGLLFRLRKGGEALYGAIPFMHGLMEFQVKRFDREFAAMMEQFFHDGFEKNIADNAELFLRVVPVQRDLSSAQKVASFDDACEILKNTETIAVAECICRKQKGLVSHNCGKPLETCFMFGSMASYYIDNKIGRQVTSGEAIKILKEAQEAGLITQPSTSQNPAGMCNCCGDCCGVIGALKKHPRPAEVIFSNHIAVIDKDACTGCGICKERCQMEAVSVGNEGFAVIDYDRCIGCGLCAMKCPADAITMEMKPEAKQRKVPADTREQMTLMAKKRGLM